jgi:hypothetical protein
MMMGWINKRNDKKYGRKVGRDRKYNRIVK